MIELITVFMLGFVVLFLIIFAIYVENKLCLIEWRTCNINKKIDDLIAAFLVKKPVKSMEKKDIKNSQISKGGKSTKNRGQNHV